MMRVHNLLQGVFAVLIGLLACLWLIAQPVMAQSAVPAIEARVVPGDVPVLQINVSQFVPATAQTHSRVIEIILDRDSLSDAMIGNGGDSDLLWQDASKVAGVLLNSSPAAPWFLTRGETSEPGKIRIGIANFDLNDANGESKAAAPDSTPLQIVLPLRLGDKAVSFDVRTGSSVDSLSAATTVTAKPEAPSQTAKTAAKAADVRFSADVAPLNALSMGTPLTLSWHVTDCVMVTLSGPIDYRQPMQTFTPKNGECSGSKKVLALGPANFQLIAEVTGSANSRFNDIITKTLSLDVRRLDQFASLILTPSYVLPGGKVTAHWYISKLPAGGHRDTILSWTDVNGNLRLLRLPVSDSQTTTGAMSFAAPHTLRDPRSNLVRLQYNDETIERSYDIEQWDDVPRSAINTGALHGMAYAGGSLVLCSEKGIFLSKVGAGGGAEAGVGKINDPYPDFTHEQISVSDKKPAVDPHKGYTSRLDPHQIENAICLAVHALDANHVVAVLSSTHSAPHQPHAVEMAVITPGQRISSYPVLLREYPAGNALMQHYDYQIAVLRGRMIVLEQAGPADPKVDRNPRSSITTASISQSDILKSTASWRQEPLLSTPELEPRYGWHMVDGFGGDGSSLFLINEVSGTVARFDAAPESESVKLARNMGSVAKLTSAREDAAALDFPKRAAPIDTSKSKLLGNGPLVNIGGVLVALGAGLAYNPQSDSWQQSPIGLTAGKGSVAAYRNDDEPRLWLMTVDKRRYTLAVNSPRLFVDDYFDSKTVANIGYFNLTAKLTIKSRVALKWQTDRQTQVGSDVDSSDTLTCKVGGAEMTVPVQVKEFMLSYPDRPFSLFGVSQDGKTSVSKSHLGNGRWDATVSSDPCVTVTVTPAVNARK